MVDIYSIRDKAKEAQENFGKQVGSQLAVASVWAWKRKKKIAVAVLGVLAVKLVIPPLVVPSYYMQVSDWFAEQAGQKLHEIKWEDREKYTKQPLLSNDKKHWMFINNSTDRSTFADKYGNPIERHCLYYHLVEADRRGKEQVMIPPRVYFLGFVRWPLIASECRVGDESFYEYFPR